ncbi:MAG: toll/interleukin-1 receptor domain-containing protein [Bacteroidales bacterium]|nr:toll/interleukin-1 receptor domain-containing protein [Bacteroidales bacterium]
MKNEIKTRYRIFISYSSKDKDQKDILTKVLENNGLCPVSNSEFSLGHGFLDQIKKFIAHSYVFMPVISKSSNKSGWVHEEIGLAIAHNIPVLPIVIEQKSLPTDMIQEFQAIFSDLKTTNNELLNKEINKLTNRLTWQEIDKLIKMSERGPRRPIYECAYLLLGRTLMLVEYASDIANFFSEQPKLFRQSGGLSSFHIPDSSPDSEEFKLRYFGSNQRVDTLNQNLREERIIFEEFAREWGFRIIIDLDLKFEESGDNALIIRNSRLNTLLKFFKGLPQSPSKPGNKFEVLIDKNLDKHRNVILIGDLFLAESLAGHQGQGLKQTMFTRHAATIKKQIELFDTRFEELKNKRSGNISVERAITEIEKRLKVIESELNSRK